MPAGLPGSTLAQNLGNPTLGQWVIFDPLSGPKGSPLDRGSAGTASTGGLQTGIGFGANHPISIATRTNPATAPQAIQNAGFDDDQIPGETTEGYGTINTINSKFMYVGGGRQTLVSGRNVDGSAGSPPYTVGIAICGAGNSGSRDGGAGPAFLGFPMKMVTAVGTVTNGSVVETGWTNRSGITITVGLSVDGSSTTTLAAAS